MKILVIRHAEFEKPGYISTWASSYNHTILEISPYLGEKLPDATIFDFLVIMGGPQSPLDLESAPYLADEIKLIKNTLQQEKPIFGICLGAQLIGEALGSKTERSPNSEVGIFPIELLETSKQDPVFKLFPSKFDVIHWHNDMPGVPESATLLAKSEGCPRQIIRYREKVYGFQCHLELNSALIEDMVKNCPDDLKPGKYINTIPQLQKINHSQINEKLHLFLDYITSK